MMTRATLKTLWLAGGGVVATWLAVTPNQGVQPPAAAAAAARDSGRATTQPTADELNQQASRLIERSRAVQFRPSERNPFQFASPRARAMPNAPVPNAQLPAAVAAPPAPPLLSLAGIAEDQTVDGPRRTAIISGAGELYLVREGDSLAGGFTVKSIEADTVVLHDQSGAELRIFLR